MRFSTPQQAAQSAHALWQLDRLGQVNALIGPRRSKALGAATDKVWEAFQGIFSGEGDYSTLIDGFSQILGG